MKCATQTRGRKRREGIRIVPREESRPRGGGLSPDVRDELEIEGNAPQSSRPRVADCVAESFISPHWAKAAMPAYRMGKDVARSCAPQPKKNGAIYRKNLDLTCYSDGEFASMGGSAASKSVYAVSNQVGGGPAGFSPCNDALPALK